jgi:TfoX/Sxy family transcriptional regulator of competence genes
MAYDEQLAARIRDTLAARADMTERRMFGGLAFLRDGRMCCGVVGQDLMVRVVEDEMPSVLRRPHVRPMDFTGRPLRGFVYVAPSGVATDDALGEWIAKGLAFTERGEAPKKSRRARRRPHPRS